MTSNPDFQTRYVKHAGELPQVGRLARIPLLMTGSEFDVRDLRKAGALGGKLGWSIARDSRADLELLDSVLPWYARRALTPVVVDLIPSTAWHASLANILTPASWKKLRDAVVTQAGGCEICGDWNRLECHELWGYDEMTGIARLKRFVSLCPDDHEIQHLGLARLRGRFPQAWERLVKINRLDQAEAKRYSDLMQDRYILRSKRTWRLDVGILGSESVNLKRKYGLDRPCIVSGEGPQGYHEIELLGVDLAQVKGGMIGLFQPIKQQDA